MTLPNEHDKVNAERTLARSLKLSQRQRESARTAINPTVIVQELIDIKILLDPVEQDDGTFATPGKEYLASLKLKADINFKLLDKVLPSIKQVEIEATHQHQHTHDISKVSTVELANRLQQWRHEQQLAAGAPNVIDVTPTVVDTAPEDPTPFL